jgi:hypothetical protein
LQPVVGVTKHALHSADGSSCMHALSMQEAAHAPEQVQAASASKFIRAGPSQSRAGSPLVCEIASTQVYVGSHIPVPVVVVVLVVVVLLVVVVAPPAPPLPPLPVPVVLALPPAPVALVVPPVPVEPVLVTTVHAPSVSAVIPPRMTAKDPMFMFANPPRKASRAR